MDAISYEFIDEAGFNRAKSRREGRNVFGHGTIIDAPGQHGANIMCTAISGTGGVLHHHSNLTVTFLVTLYNILTPPGRMNDADHQRNRYLIEPP